MAQLHGPDGSVHGAAGFTVLHGRAGSGAPIGALTDRIEGPRLLLLAGQRRRVTWIDWKRRHCFDEPAERGRARWLTEASAASPTRRRAPCEMSCSARTCPRH
jgi:ATP-dependent Lhr-like helicase